MADPTTTVNEGPSESEQVAILAQPTPDHIAAWRGEDTARTLFKGNEQFSDAAPDKMFDGADAPAASRQAAVRELRGMLADTGLTSQDAGVIMNQAKVVRATGRSAQDQRRETRAALESAFGTDADRALADANKLINRDPRFSKYLRARGLGNDAATIVTLARAARSQLANGRLK